MRPIRLRIIVVAMLGALTLPSFARADDTLQQIALAILGEKFGISTQQATDFQRLSGLDPFDAAPAYATSHYSSRSLADVWKLRRQGLGWGEIARRLGVAPQTLNRLRQSGALDRDAIWSSLIKSRYGYRDRDIMGLRRRSGSYRDVLPACMIAHASQRTPTVIYERYRRDRGWNRTAGVYRVDLSRHARSAGRATKPDDRGQPTWSGHGRDDDRDKAKNTAKHKSKDKGARKSHGNSGAEGRGHKGR
ncbi:MAG: hypothetical protein FJX72_04015 [Armatimonadetes bacterium]|nr:hypothetical protein [Armatimonadota bacterium]